MTIEYSDKLFLVGYFSVTVLVYGGVLLCRRVVVSKERGFPIVKTKMRI